MESDTSECRHEWVPYEFLPVPTRVRFKTVQGLEEEHDNVPKLRTIAVKCVHCDEVFDL